MTRRREFLAGLAGVTVAAGATVAAVASSDPDADLLALVHALKRASADVERLAAIWSEADDRAEARYPALPPFAAWAEANHPAGPFMNPNNRESPGRAVMVDLLRRAPGGVAAIDWEGPEGEQFADAMVKAGREYYAEMQPAYDALVAEHRAAVKAIDDAEGLDAASDAVAAAERRQGEAVAALLACRPKTASGFVQKVAALLAHLESPDFEIGSEPASILADARALIVGGVA